MRTLYVTSPSTYSPASIVISDEKEAAIGRAVSKVTDIVESEPGWQPFIDLSINNTFKVRVTASKNKGDVQSFVDIGHYEGDKGWRSAAVFDTDDYSRLPDAWFSRDFMDIEPFDLRRVPILEQHKGNLLDQFTAHVEKTIMRRGVFYIAARGKPSPREIAFGKGVLSLITDVRDGKLPETILQEVWSSRLEIFDSESEQNNRSSSVERE